MKVIRWTMLILGAITLFILMPRIEINAQPLAISESIVLQQSLSEKNACEGHSGGMANVYDPHGHLFAEVPCENGKLAKDGTAKVYNLDGSLRVEIPYKNSKFLDEERTEKFVEDSFKGLSGETDYVESKTGASILKSIYFSAKSYYSLNQHYPHSIEDLTSAKPPYIDPQLASGNAYDHNFAIINTNNDSTFLVIASSTLKDDSQGYSYCITEDGILRFESGQNKINSYDYCKKSAVLEK